MMRFYPVIRVALAAAAIAACAPTVHAAADDASGARQTANGPAPSVAMQGTPAPNPYSFADLFHLTVEAQYGLVSGTVPEPVAGRPGAADADGKRRLTPALFGGAGVPGIALGSSAPADAAMIGIPQDPGPRIGEYAVRVGPEVKAAFRFEQQLIPLDRMPQPAGWLVAASAALVAVYMARRRTRRD